MAGIRLALVAVVCVLAVAALGCDSGGGGDGGSNPFGSDRPKSPASAASDAEAALKGCTQSCSADIEAGREALAGGDIAGAIDAFQCANTPEAAFGAGFATLLGAVESESMDRVLADFGMAHFAASNIVGPDGWLSRQAARWNGTGSLAISGDLSTEIAIQSAMVAEPYDSFDPGELEASGSADGFQVDIDVYSYSTLTEGIATSLLYDCASATGPASLVTTLPQVYIVIEELATGTSYECNIPFSRDATFCQQELGTLEVVAAGTQVGEPVTLAFQETGLSCFAFEGGDGLQREIVVTGTVSATVSGEVDTSDMHELLHDDIDYGVARIPENVTVNALLAHGTALSKDFAKASCLFEAAAKGDGEVFTLPSGLLGGSDIAVNAADAKLLGALAAASAAVLQIGGAYASELPLRDVACMLTEGDDDSGACGETELHVAAVNDAIHEAGLRLDRLAAARTFLLDGLERFRLAVPMLDESTLFPRTAMSAAGIDAMDAIAEALQRSIEDGSAALPFVSPTIEMRLLDLFSDPPAPDSVRIAAFIYDEDCDEFDCWSDLELSASFCSSLWSPIGLDFNGDYETSEEGDQIEDAFEVFWNSLESRQVFRGADF